MEDAAILRADAPEFVPGGDKEEDKVEAPAEPKSLSLAEALSDEKKEGKETHVPTASQIASDAAMIYGGSTLTDAMDAMEYAGHSSALYIADDGSVKGVVTENDILRAYCEHKSGEQDVESWLQSGEARAPGHLLPMLTVDGAMPLVNAAAKMAVQKHTPYACHHLLIEGGKLGHHHILSALDITMAICNGDLDASALGPKAVVSDIMKKRDVVPMVKGSDSLKSAFDFLLSSGQNLALVADDENGFVYGTITPRDASRAFGEHVPDETTISGWLRGLQANLDPRRIEANCPLTEAAQVMVASNLHHLCVVEPDSSDVIGVISCLDIVCRIGEFQLGSPASPPPGMLEPSDENMPEVKLEEKSDKVLKEDGHPAWQ